MQLNEILFRQSLLIVNDTLMMTFLRNYQQQLFDFLRMPMLHYVIDDYNGLMKMGSIFKKQCKLRQRQRSYNLSGGCGQARIFYIITVMTAVGVALGDGRHYNTYLCKYSLRVVSGWEKQLLLFGLSVSE